MYIKNATYKAVPTGGMSFPITEGTVVTAGGVTGIVTENLSAAGPTAMIYVAVGGTIDLRSEANKGVSFTDEQVKALGSDFNFIPASEAPESELPAYTAADENKILSLGKDDIIIVPEQTATADDGALTLEGDENILQSITVGDTATLTINGTSLAVTGTEMNGIVVFANETYGIGCFGGYIWMAVINGGTGLEGSYTVSLKKAGSNVVPKWVENGGGGGGGGLPEYTSADNGKVLALGEGSSSTTEVIVPEQSVTTDDGIGITNLSYSDTHTEAEQLVSDGATATLVVDGVEMTATFQNILLGDYAWPAAVSDSYKIVWNGGAGDNGLVTFYGTGYNTYTIELYRGVPAVAPVWEANKVVITPSNATLTHLQTKLGAAMQSFFASQTNVKYYDHTSNVLTDDDLANINTAYAEMSTGNTNVVLSALGVLFTIAIAASDTLMFVLPYYRQSYSSITVAVRITVVLVSTNNTISVVVEKLYDSRT